MYTLPEWTIQSAFRPILSALLAFIYGLFILAYPPPPKYKKLSILLLALPVAYAFTQQHAFSPNWTACDTFGRFLYIWLAHMSYEVIILEFEPKTEVVKENVRAGWKSRVREAYSVLFDRNHTQVLKDAGAQPATATPRKHNLSRKQFVLYHIGKALALYLAQAAWTAYQELIPFTWSAPEKANFFRRLPASLDAGELYFRLDLTFDWCIINMFLYESFHSAFAVIFVGILRLDSPQEWCMSLCGSLGEAWSVRRYWGKHWHNYIYHSFSSHIKILTRDWLSFKRGKSSTRLLENSLIFLASGLMHSLVRWAQNPDSDMWCITFWYVGQMLPIVIEGVVQDWWRQARKRLGVRSDDRRVNALEKAVGYAWVTGWFMWSVPKYVHTRNAWSRERMKRKYEAVYNNVEGGARNDTD